MSKTHMTSLAVIPLSDDFLEQAGKISKALNIELLDTGSKPELVKTFSMVLCCSSDGLQLQQTGPKAPGPVYVDFVSGAVAHRRKFGGGAGQQIAKAVGIKSGVRPYIADVTAGLGKDAFVLATLGCEISLVERSSVVAMLLQDGLERGYQDLETAQILARMELFSGNGADWLQRSLGNGRRRPDVVYLDPMFPHSKKSAQVKKEMSLFRELIGDDTDTAELLETALKVANNRVVVKRPRKAPNIDGPMPSFSLEGKSGRFDIYALKSF